MNPPFLCAYFVKGLGVSLPVWNALAFVLSNPRIILKGMENMALKTGFVVSGNRYELEATVREFKIEERGFVVDDLMFYFENYGLETNCGEYTESLGKFWRMQDGKFFLDNKELPFDEWIRSYEEENKNLKEMAAIN